MVSGIVFAFLPFRFDHYAQVQLQQAQWIPFALWSLHRIVRTGRLRDGAWLGLSVTAQLLSCMYYGLFLMLYLAVVGGWILAWRAAAWRRWLPAALVAAVVSLVLFAPAARAYIGARAIVGERGRQENISFSATWSNYLAAPDTNRLYGATAERFGGLERNLFPGLVAVALAVLAIWPPFSVVRTAYAIGLLFAVDLTLGFNGLTYPLLYDMASPMRALRIPALAVVLVGFSLAVLAGYGAARIRWRGAIPLLCALILFECLSTPMPLMATPRTAPAVYADVVRDGGSRSTIVELPIIYSRDSRYQDQIYMYDSDLSLADARQRIQRIFPAVVSGSRSNHALLSGPAVAIHAGRTTGALRRRARRTDGCRRIRTDYDRRRDVRLRSDAARPATVAGRRNQRVPNRALDQFHSRVASMQTFFVSIVSFATNWRCHLATRCCKTL